MSEQIASVETKIPRRAGNTKTFAIIALLVAAAAFVAITVGGIGKNLVYYWTPSQLHKAGNKAYGATIRLGGLVAPGSIKYGKTASSLEFDVTDKKATVHVKATSMPPQMFREGIGVVVEGTMTRGGWFESNRLMVSHNNEYRAPKPGEQIDSEKMIKSTVGIGKDK
ncbi:MAG: cytochrome c maturation protein CcmE [Thermoanaerobaculia bacterium]